MYQMPYIIDGNNLIGSAPDISLDDANSRRKIIEIVRKFQQNRKHNMIVVFDGEPEHGPHWQAISGKFTVVYSRFGRSADDEIKEILNGYTYFKDVVLVSSDRDLKDFAKKKGARVINSTEFYFKIKRFYRAQAKKEDKRKRIDAQLSDSEVDQWLKIFEE